MDIIKVKNLTRTFKSGTVETHVLKGIDLSVKKGEWLAIMGKSGAGKSTLMYQMSLLDYPTSGSIFVEDKNILEMKDYERTRFRLSQLGYVFQDHALLPELSAVENVIVPLVMQGYSDSESRDLAIKSLERLALGHRLNNRPSQLSGGEQQRVSIARAVAKNPEILFADEPTANLDSASSEEVIQTLKGLHDEGQTIVMVTHEYEYTKFCDRVLWVEDGLITSEKKPYKETRKKLPMASKKKSIEVKEVKPKTKKVLAKKAKPKKKVVKKVIKKKK